MKRVFFDQRKVVIMATNRNVYVEKLKGNIEQWNAGIDEFQAKVDAQVAFLQQIWGMKAGRQEAEGKPADFKRQVKRFGKT